MQWPVCPHNSLDSDHIIGDKLRVRRKNFNYWRSSQKINPQYITNVSE